MSLMNNKNLALAAIIIVNLLVWAASVANGFVYDDNTILIGNPWIRDPGRIGEVFSSSMMAFDPSQPPANTYRPMLYLVFMAEFAVFGLDPRWFHGVNVLLHAGNAVMLFMLTRRLIDSGGQKSVLPALIAALVFSVHTINSEAVNWVSASAELLFTFCVFLAIYIHIGRVNTSGRVASAMLFFIALLFKETAAAFLALAVLCDSGSGKSVFRNWKAYAWYAGAAAVYTVMRFNAIGGLMHHKQIDFSFVDAVINIFPLVSIYFAKLLFPVSLSAMYEFRPAVSVFDPRVLSGFGIAVVFMAGLFLARKKPLVFSGLAIMVLPVLPVLYVPALSSSAVADRYLYLPSAGLAMVLSAILYRVEGKGLKIALAVSCAALIAWTVGSIARSKVWRSDLALWADAVQKAPGMPNAHYNYAWASHNAGNLNEAVSHYQEASRLSPSADAHFNLGIIYLGQSLFDEAESEFRTALVIDPGFSGARLKLMEVQRFREAGA